MRTSTFVGRWGLVALALLLTPTLLEAQRPGSGPGSGMNREQMEARVLQQFEARMARELELSPTQRERFSQAMESFRVERGALLQERFRLQARIRRHLEGGGAGEGETFLRELNSLRERDLELQRREEETLLTFLSADQILRLQVARENFAQRIRMLEQSGGPGRRGGGGGPHRLP